MVKLGHAFIETQFALDNLFDTEYFLMYVRIHPFEILFWGNARLLVLGELAEEEGDPDGKEDEEEPRCVHDLCLSAFRHILQIAKCQ